MQELDHIAREFCKSVAVRNSPESRCHFANYVTVADLNLFGSFAAPTDPQNPHTAI